MYYKSLIKKINLTFRNRCFRIQFSIDNIMKETKMQLTADNLEYFGTNSDLVNQILDEHREAAMQQAEKADAKGE